jgi:hypothetical protein
MFYHVSGAMCEEGVWLRQKMQPLTFEMKGKANEKMFF